MIGKSCLRFVGSYLEPLDEYFESRTRVQMLEPGWRIKFTLWVCFLIGFLIRMIPFVDHGKMTTLDEVIEGEHFLRITNTITLMKYPLGMGMIIGRPWGPSENDNLFVVPFSKFRKLAWVLKFGYFLRLYVLAAETKRDIGNRMTC